MVKKPSNDDVILRSLVIHRFRNVNPGTKLTFSARKNVLLGENATGKTTLLELIAACLTMRSDVKHQFIAGMEPLNIEFTITVGWFKIHTHLHTRKPIGPNITSDALDGPNKSPQIDAEISITWKNNRCIMLKSALGFSCRYNGDIVFVNKGYDSTPGFMLSLLAAALGETTPKHPLYENLLYILLHWHRAGAHLQRFDESLGYFSTIHKSPITIQIPLNRLSKLQIVGRLSDDMRNEILSRFETTSPGQARAPLTQIIIDGDKIPCIKELATAFECSGAKIELSLQETTKSDSTEDCRYSGLSFVFLKKDGTTVRDNFLSFGQKRLLSFYVYLAINAGPVIADELVNGLHHKWIRDCVSKLTGRQCFLASQNPLIVDCLSFSSANEFQSSFIECRTIASDGRIILTWNNLPHAKGKYLYSAYKTGLQYVSEILKTEGLW